MGTGCCGCCKSKAIAPSSKPNKYRSIIPPKTIAPKPRSPRIRRELAPMGRFSNVYFPKDNLLSLIDGYLDEPVVSLEEALEPFHGKIDQLTDKIQKAKTKCYHPCTHNLTHDDSAAIYIYTLKWKSTCLYDHLQAAWYSEDRSQLEPWFKYLKLLKSALEKLPNANTEVWQGKVFDEKVKERLMSNSLPLYSSMGSGSPLPNEIKVFHRKKGGTKLILIGYDGVDAKVVTRYTANNVDEVIIWPGTKLGVAKYALTDANGSVIAHLVAQIRKYHCNRVLSFRLCSDSDLIYVRKTLVTF
jgi:hypothetical protein